MRAGGQILAGLSAALAVATAARLPAAWQSGNALNHVSGAWLTLADDLARGTFYRPLHDAAVGYGGTRYFPLPFALEAGLQRAGMPLLAAGYAAGLAAGILLVAGTFLLLRALGRGRLGAAAFAPLALAGFAGQHALAAARGDLLPVALSALGLAAVAGGRLAAGALALVLAFAAKPTALTAAAAAVLWLLLRGRGRAAGTLAALVGAGAAFAVLATQLLSGARFLPLVAGAASGGAGPADAARAPLRLAQELLTADRAGLFACVAAAAALAAALPALARGGRAPAAPALLLAALWFGAAGAGALAVLALPGTGVNHLVELEASAAVLLGVAAGAGGRAATIARTAAPLAAAAGLALAASLWRADLASSRLGEIRALLRALPPGGPILSEDPLVPLLAGQRPYLLDPWTLRLAAAAAPEVAAPLAGAIRRGGFPAVVLFQDLDGPEADAWYAAGNLGLPLVSEIRRAYRPALRVGRYHLYVPASDPPAPPPRAPAIAAPPREA